MSFLHDNLIPFFKKRDVAFLERIKESDDVYSFLFEQPNGLTWKAGQYGLFTITHKKIKNATKPFSVASAPSENLIRITTRIGDEPSDFKKAMLELQQGMNVNMRGPVGPFYLTEDSPTLMMAGGIGVTPFRSILKQLEAEGKERRNPITLLYMDSAKRYVFKDELDGLANNPAVSIIYLDSREDLNQEIQQFAALNQNAGKYFIAGPKSMTQSVAVYLNSLHISKKNVIKEGFFGI